MLSLSKRCVVTLPNLGYWKCRLDIMNGRMPVTPELPSSWYETENIHLCTIKILKTLLMKKLISLIKFFNRNGKEENLLH